MSSPLLPLYQSRWHYPHLYYLSSMPRSAFVFLQLHSVVFGLHVHTIGVLVERHCLAELFHYVMHNLLFSEALKHLRSLVASSFLLYEFLFLPHCPTVKYHCHVHSYFGFFVNSLLFHILFIIPNSGEGHSILLYCKSFS